MDEPSRKMSGGGVDWQSPASITAALDLTLHTLGFEYELVSPEKMIGSLKVTEKCCQPFGVLNGGVSALIAESMASLGAYVASGCRRVAGVQLSTNHIRAVLLGDVVEAEATPIQLGKTIQVWEVEIWKRNVSAPKNKILTSKSRVILIANREAPVGLRGYEAIVKKYAKL